MSHGTYDLKEALRIEWDGSSGGYDAQHSHGIQTQEERQAWIDLFRSITPAGSLDILDVGCGTGEISMVLGEMGHRVTGIDLSKGMLDKARKKAGLTDYRVGFFTGDAEALTFADNSFDLVVNRHLLWTLPSPDAALKEWSRVLRPGGSVAIIDGLWRDDSFSEKCRRFTGNLGVLLTERKNQFGEYYSPEMIHALPHPYGMTADVALGYVKDAGFVSPGIHPMTTIMAIQQKHMPLSRRISFHKTYFLITGRKP